MGAFLVGFFIFGLFWGRAWNSKWGFVNHLPSAIMNAVFGVALAGAALLWIGAVRTSSWIDAQRDGTSSQIAGSGVFNREVLRDAWDKISPLGGQQELTAPADGGNEIRLNNANETHIFAASAATMIKRYLPSYGPFASAQVM